MKEDLASDDRFGECGKLVDAVRELEEAYPWGKSGKTWRSKPINSSASIYRPIEKVIEALHDLEGENETNDRRRDR